MSVELIIFVMIWLIIGLLILKGCIYEFVLVICFFIYGSIEIYSVCISILLFLSLGVLIFLILNVFFWGMFFGILLKRICLFCIINYFFLFEIFIYLLFKC